MTSVGIGMSHAWYTTYTSDGGYQQPHQQYVPYYHGNRGYDYQHNRTQRYTNPQRRTTDRNHTSGDYYYNSDDDYLYSYSDNDDYDIRYDYDNYYVDNTISHQDTYHITAYNVDIDNNNYYGSYGTYRNTATYPIYDTWHVKPASESCKTHGWQPRDDDYYASIGLKITPQVAKITKYRIKRSNGQRSRWYVPGQNDIKDTWPNRYKERMRADFGSREYEYVVCDNPIAYTYRQYNHHYYPMLMNGHYTSSSYADGYNNHYRKTIQTFDRRSPHQIRATHDHTKSHNSNDWWEIYKIR